MKTLPKTVAIVALLSGLTVAAQAQTVIGSWLSANAEPTQPVPSQDEGWQRGQGGFGPNGSIFASSNCPSAFDVYAGVAAGYSQSLVVHETGYGSVRLYVSLTGSQIAAMTNNNKLNFTFSVPPGDSNTTSGYLQLVQFQFNAGGGVGFNNYNPPSTAAGFSETGDTANDSSGQPIFYYSTTSPARQQVVTFDYSRYLTNLVSAGYVQMVWVFQTSGGELTNIYINNVNLSGAPGNPSIIIDQFNPTNNPYAGTNVYAATDNEITNIYNLWTGYGGNYVVNPDNGGVIWDPTQDANGNANSGSLKITANWTNGAGQYLVWDRGPGNTFALNPPITNGYSLLTFEFDVKYDPSSPTVVNGTVTNYGHMEIGPVPPYSPMTFGTFDYNVTNTGWVHVSVPVNAGLDPADLLSINGVYFKQYGGFYGNLNGTTVLWIDNINFTYTNIPPVIPPPTVSMAKATPVLRIFAGDASDIYHREQLATSEQDKSWVGASARPSQYSFKLLSYPANINQTHIMLFPLNFISSGNTPYSYNGADYSFASNLLWLVLSPGPSAGSVVGRIQWKTNEIGANPDHTDLVFTNPAAVGTWSLQFNNDSSGQVLAPGGNSYPFTVSDPNVTTDFGGPMVVFFGLQPNGTAGEGQYEDWAFISISNVVGTSDYEDFTTEPARSTAGPWTAMDTAPSLIVVSTNDSPAYWVSWNLPAVGFDIGSKTNLLAAGPWISPQYYGAYFDNTPPYGKASQLGPFMWMLLPKDDLPTADGSQGGPLAPRAYFIGATNVVFP